MEFHVRLYDLTEEEVMRMMTDSTYLSYYDDEGNYVGKIIRAQRHTEKDVGTAKAIRYTVKRDVEAYYFVSFMYGASNKIHQHLLIKEHPLKWQKHCNENYGRQYVLLHWQEISKELYDEYADHLN